MFSLLIAYLAGVITILSPCVLPLLPIVLGGALSAHRRGPWALAAGLVVSFTAFGLLVSTMGFAIGLTPQLLNKIAAVIMIAFGMVLLIEPLQTRFFALATQATGLLNAQVSGYSPEGLGGQFFLGAVLGAVWTPCVGPTLGAAIALAASGQAVGYAGLVMLMFALGTATSLLVIMIGSREMLARHRSRLSGLVEKSKPVLGLLLVVMGFMFLSGAMTAWEAWGLDHTPDWLTQIIYSI